MKDISNVLSCGNKIRRRIENVVDDGGRNLKTEKGNGLGIGSLSLVNKRKEDTEKDRVNGEAEISTASKSTTVQATARQNTR